ncbi:hypothetical protein BD324DRAFT_621794 [Kockovaella imperatae]|uniref:GDT1 family protein n=1 Tax=Kockovaella imperatae TaxID=4999 RepID=A0A1Y1UKR9_9TREE|nr:hypothetical protein BD324DRAFT_621794 [Kockovaella imperatae]ORX38650.1 hypothetical protein BD324DRAFT_621794 [Kockovaella imperatae]
MMQERALIDQNPTADAFLQAFIMIVVSEIGDKTFLIAAIMATRHARATVFGGAFASLVIMSILSAALGKVILGLIPKVWTLWAAAVLFLVFGIRMLQEAMKMSGGNSHIQDEMREVEEELEQDSSRHDVQNQRHSGGTDFIPLEAVEEGRSGLQDSFSSPRSPTTPRSTSNGRARSPSPSTNTKSGPSIHFPLSKSSPEKNRKSSFKTWINQIRDFLQLVTSPVFAQAFILTFLGEWGDRSQLSTIMLSASNSVPVVAFGTILGHGLCTCGAVIGGRYLSTKISVKHITLMGAAAFLIFAVLYVGEALYTPADAITGSMA